MTVHGADAVDAAHAGGANRLVVGRTDIVTPLARERARDIGVDIVVDGPPSTGTRTAAAVHVQPSGPTATRPATGSSRRSGGPVASAITDGARTPAAPSVDASSPSPALYRRGAPLPASVRIERLVRGRGTRREPTAGERSATRVRRVGVVGAGNVGMIAAMRLAESDLIDEVVLVDTAGGRAAGIALDITHASPLLGFATEVRGVTSLLEAGPCDYVVITAGRARTPGMSRGDLVGTNAAIVGSLARDAVAVSPDAVLLIVTNPLDEMTQHAWEVSGLPSERVIGMAGLLDSSRFRALTALAAGVHPRAVSALALGSHGDEMVMPLSQAMIDGTPIDRALSAPVVDALVTRTRDSGAEVVSLLESGSAFFAPGLSAARMVVAMITESDEMLAATVAPHGEYGITSGYVGLPVRLGRSGLAEIVELPLSDSEIRDLRIAADRIAQRVGAMETAAV